MGAGKGKSKRVITAGTPNHNVPEYNIWDLVLVYPRSVAKIAADKANGIKSAVEPTPTRITGVHFNEAEQKYEYEIVKSTPVNASVRVDADVIEPVARTNNDRASHYLNKIVTFRYDTNAPYRRFDESNLIKDLPHYNNREARIIGVSIREKKVEEIVSDGALEKTIEVLCFQLHFFEEDQATPPKYRFTLEDLEFPLREFSVQETDSLVF